MASEHIAELKKWVAELVGNGNRGEALAWNRALELIGKNFGVETHEIAILGLTPDERSLRFLAPSNLRPVGQIPLSSANALAARTVREGRPEVINHFYAVPHASVFEGVPITEDHRGDPIQKIMSAPVIVSHKVIGVVQVSRKGKTPADAGPDFTFPDLRALAAISDALVPCLQVCAEQ